MLIYSRAGVTRRKITMLSLSVLHSIYLGFNVWTSIFTIVTVQEMKFGYAVLLQMKGLVLPCPVCGMIGAGCIYPWNLIGVL